MVFLLTFLMSLSSGAVVETLSITDMSGTFAATLRALRFNRKKLSLVIADGNCACTNKNIRWLAASVV